MKKAIAAVALSIAVLCIPGTASASVDNFGECQELARLFGIPAQEFTPRYLGAGPGVIIYDTDGTILALHSAQGFDFGVSCTVR